MLPTSLQAPFRKFLGKDSEALAPCEEAALGELSRSHQRLVTEGGRVNTKSEQGFNACHVFLENLDAAAKAMKLDAAPRTYRVHFTINYRALFPDEARNYRVDVLEASVEQYAVIWVNGDKFEFSAEAMRRAEALQRSWNELSQLLDRWRQATEQPRHMARPARTELRNALVALDCTWASFEHKYIAELIDIEEKARRLVVQAIKHERGLELLEKQYGVCETGKISEALQQNQEYQDELAKLVGCIAHLNSVANFRRKGRDDLKATVLFDAMNTLRRCDAGEAAGNAELFAAARILAKDVVESFIAMREYLREVERCLERVDPHLCNNVGLVARLVDWEESWEVGTRYVQHEQLLSAVCDLVAEIRTAQRLAPALQQMCEDCDVELFLVLPRIIWLRFLARPTQNIELVRSILPHRFPTVAGEENAQPSHDGELRAFVDRFARVQQLLMRAFASAPSLEKAAWEVLVKRVVSGSGGEEVFGGLSVSMRAEAEAETEDLMLELEKWSIELQRHCPEDWNQASAILVQCLTGGTEKQKPAAFRV